MQIKSLLLKENVIFNLNAKNKADAIKEMAQRLFENSVITNVDDFVKDVVERENVAHTALENEVATPHAKSKTVKLPSLLVAYSDEGIDFCNGEEVKSKLFFLIAMPENEANLHIDVLSKLANTISENEKLEKLFKCKDYDEIIKIIDEDDVKIQVAENKDFIVAVTACPTGIAHTFMAAEALKVAAKELGVSIKVETNGTDGRKNEITPDDIKMAKGVILAVNRNVDENRFKGIQVIKVDAKEAINKAKELIIKILNNEGVYLKVSDVENQDNNSQTSGLYKHLMSGVSYMLPLVISGGILIAFAFLFDSILGYSNAGTDYGQATEIARMFKNIGGAAFGLFVPILGGYISYSIAERAGLTAGLVAGALASSGGSGFLGAIVGGIFAGYTIKMLEKLFKNLPKSLNGIKLILFYPVLSVLITGIAMILALNPVVSIINKSLVVFLESMSGSSKIILGLLLGAMMAVDMGGPVNKAAYLFATGTLEATLQTGGSSAMAATMAGGMVPPLAIAIATTIFKNLYNKQEQEAGLSNYIMGLSFITEGAIPFAAANPLRVIPALVVGSSIGGAMTMFFDIKIPAPHGGILVMFLSNNFLLYLLCIITGSVIGALLLAALKQK